VTFFSSAALSMLLRFRAETSREVSLLDPSNEMRRSLKITGLDEMFLSP
jgi:anti-anti-sigma regulatory factor